MPLNIRAIITISLGLVVLDTFPQRFEPYEAQRAGVLLVLAVVGLIIYLFLARHYEIKYVYDYSSAELEFGFRIAAMWAMPSGVAGSPSWVMIIRAALPSGDRNSLSPRRNSGLRNASGGR